MKYIYTLAIIILVFGIKSGVEFLVDYEEPTQDKILTKTPAGPEALPTPDLKGRELPDLEPIWERSLFAEYRGEVDTQAAQQAKVQPTNVSMELIGIIKLGNTSGAIIIDKSPARRGRVSTTAQKKGGRPSKYYRLNQVLANGYKLAKINKDSVIMISGNTEIELKMEFGDMSSLSRNKKEVSDQTNRVDQAESALESTLPKTGTAETAETAETATTTPSTSAKSTKLRETDKKDSEPAANEVKQVKRPAPPSRIRSTLRSLTRQR